MIIVDACDSDNDYGDGSDDSVDDVDLFITWLHFPLAIALVSTPRHLLVLGRVSEGRH